MKQLSKWLDVIFLMFGMIFISIGAFKIYTPAGFITIGVCFIAIAFFIAKKQAEGR